MRSYSASMIIVALLCSTTVQAVPSQRQLKLFHANCAQCHVGESRFIPTLGKAEDWSERNHRGEDAMLQSVIQGRGGMPPAGYCSACTEDDLRALIRLLSGLTGE
ncbi:c-type cytochrome [Amphritea pacifica]|uniref:Cytochrome c5 family protein n=1 Tax=Amphritea pacifica TaxID=2811233 RepID=A0ABS2W7H7_9GAMM|nr:c-type cytochrome [Amphritea pacifica]MBN0987638.1 cytochrome c5 family protein [Amphritea pacifica]MBN1009052.1 cytochrome c5 family protein [Amphritea pacifica]